MSTPVRISDLIEHLWEWHERFGDCPVYVKDPYAEFLVEVKHVELDVGWSRVMLTVSPGWEE